MHQRISEKLSGVPKTQLNKLKRILLYVVYKHSFILKMLFRRIIVCISCENIKIQT